jgi:hypothetical protein
MCMSFYGLILSFCSLSKLGLINFMLITHIFVIITSSINYLFKHPHNSDLWNLSVQFLYFAILSQVIIRSGFIDQRYFFTTLLIWYYLSWKCICEKKLLGGAQVGGGGDWSTWGISKSRPAGPSDRIAHDIVPQNVPLPSSKWMWHAYVYVAALYFSYMKWVSRMSSKPQVVLKNTCLLRSLAKQRIKIKIIIYLYLIKKNNTI